MKKEFVTPELNVVLVSGSVVTGSSECTPAEGCDWDSGDED